MSDILEQNDKVVELYDARQEEELGLAKVLAPFSDNLQYDLDRIIQECRMCLQMEVMMRFEVGRRLILVYNYEGVQTFALLIAKHFPGMSRRSAFNYMLFSRKAQELPKFQAWAGGKDNWSKALTIMQSVNEEELREFEENGSVLDMPVDELDKMSVRELKTRIKKLEKDKKAAVLEAVDKVGAENVKLREQVEALAAAQETPGLEAAKKLIRQADRQIHEGLQLLRRVDWDAVGSDWAARLDALQKLDLITRLVGTIEGEIYRHEAEPPETDGANG